MKINPITYTFACFYTGDTVIEYTALADKAFLRNLFNDPVNTVESINGSVISCNIDSIAGAATHRFEIISNRITLLAPSAEVLVAALTTVTNNLNVLNKDAGFRFTQYALTYDFEVLDFIEEGGNISEWLSSKLVSDALNKNTDFDESTAKLRVLEYQISNKQGIDYVINIQPRVNNSTSVYFRVSEVHKTLEGDLLSNLKKEIEDSQKYIYENCLKLIQ